MFARTPVSALRFVRRIDHDCILTKSRVWLLIANLKEALKDREFLLSLIHFRDHETKDETFEIEVMFPGMIVIKMECLTREIVYNKVNKTVIVEGKEYSREESVRKDTKWHRKTGSWGCFVSKLETSDEPC